MRKQHRAWYSTAIFSTFLCFSLLLTPAMADAAVIYVDADAAPGGDGTSWASAYQYLQDALTTFAASYGSGDEIWVAAGTYYPDEGSGQTDDDRASTFNIPDLANLYGGFDGTDGAGGGAQETVRSQSDPNNNVTVLSGDLTQNDIGFTNNDENAYHVITFTTPGSYLVDGFMITAGNGGNGAGIYYNYSSSTGIRSLEINNCTITMNNGLDGGGMFISSFTSPILTNCIFTNNTATDRGGAIYLGEYLTGSVSGNSVLTNCSFSGNTANEGGAVYNDGYFTLGQVSPVLTNCTFSGNSANYGGSMYNYSFCLCEVSPILTNCTFSGSKANNEGNEIYNKYSAIFTCTSPQSDPIQMTNCIVWNDSPIYNNSSGAIYAYCDIKDSGGSAAWDASLGTDNGNNIDANPLFINPPDSAAAPTTAGDVHLLSGSPCINQGTATGAPLTDVDGETRDAIPDIGVDEYTANAGMPVLYVDADAAPGGDGTSWANAYQYLPDALATFAASCGLGDEIWVAAGTYYPDEGSGQINDDRVSTFDIPDLAKLYGGFDGTDGTGGGALETARSQRDPDNNATVLSGDLTQNDIGFTNNDENAYHVVFFDKVTAPTVLDGFTITGGNSNHTTSITYADRRGGGIYNSGGSSGSNPSLTDCFIMGNNAGTDGGGICNYEGNPTMSGCVIAGNTAGRNGGGIYNDTYNLGLTGPECSPTIINCIFSGNTAGGDGGAMYNDSYGGPVRPTITNCTFAGNSAAIAGNEIYNYVMTISTLTIGACEPQFTNCVIWNDAAISNDSDSVPAYAYCDIKNSGGSAAWDASLGTDSGNNIDADPLFVAPPDPAAAPTMAGDVHLLTGSPCINQGTPVGAPATDIDTDPRDAAPDMGADEFLADTDGDGEPDITDLCPTDPLKIAPGICGCGTPDTDTDADGTPDCNDGCPTNPFKIFPGVCGCGTLDTDTDADGTPDCNDNCPTDPLKIDPGACGCGIPDTDTDGDGTPDCITPAVLPPVANPGPDQTVESETVVNLDGSGSYDPDGTITSYHWEQTAGPTVTLTDADGPNAIFVSPLAETEDILLTFTLTVTDNDGLSSSVPVNITVSAVDEEPCELPPDAISPEDGDVDLTLTPLLVIYKDIDPVTCGTPVQTNWQISESPDFNGLVYDRNILEGDLFSHQVPQGILQPDTTYYWRANIHCSSGCTSEYSASSSFTTSVADNDVNENGVPDDQELTGVTDLNGDGQPDDFGVHFMGVITIVGNVYVAIETSGNITSLQSLDHQDQSILKDMPDNMPWGLINFRVEATTPGETLQVTVYFDEIAPNGSALYQYDPITGWIDYSGHTALAPDMGSLTIEVQDGGFGDADGTANGVIVYTGGIGVSNGGSGNGCFLNTILIN